MKWTKDGDQICVTRDDFVNLQESPAVFVDADSETGKIIVERGIRNLPLGDLSRLAQSLHRQHGQKRDLRKLND